MPMLAPGIPGISKVGKRLPVSFTWISISFWSSSPVRNILRNLARVSGADDSPTKASRTLSSAIISALLVTSLRMRSRVWLTLISIKSRMICSTSRPT